MKNIAFDFIGTLRAIYSTNRGSLSNHTTVQNPCTCSNHTYPAELDFYDMKGKIILELVKDYLEGTWIIVEMTKSSNPTFYDLEMIESKKINEYNLFTYVTDKRKPVSSTSFRTYIDLTGLDTFLDRINKLDRKDN